MGGQRRASDEADTRSDEILVERILAGHPEEFRVLYERYFRRVYRFALARLGNAAEAEDVTQDTFVALLQSLPSFRERSAFATWVLGVARNTVHGHLRTHRRRRAREEESLERPGSGPGSPDAALRGSRLRAALSAHLAEAPEWHGRVFALRHLDALSIREIAGRTRRSRYAVRLSLARSYARLERELGG